MGATLRIAVALSTAAAGVASMIAGALLVFQVNNETVPPPSGFTELAILELFVVGGVLLSLGIAGVIRNAPRPAAGSARGVGRLLGVGLLVGGLGWEAMTPDGPQVSALTFSEVTAAIFTGPVVMAVTLNSITAVRSTPVPTGTEGLPDAERPATPAIDAPARWAVCPYCAEPTLPDQPRC